MILLNGYSATAPNGELSTLSWGILYDSHPWYRNYLEKRCWAFNPLLRNSLWFLNIVWRQCNRKVLFQPSLEEFFVIHYLRYHRQYSQISRFQPSLEGFFMIQLHYQQLTARDFIDFNPLLRDSLWFYVLAADTAIAKIKDFNPLLRDSLWFHTTRMGAVSTSSCRISTLSWGILYDSTAKSENSYANICVNFNPLLRDSLWFINQHRRQHKRRGHHNFNPLLRDSLWFKFLVRARRHR